MEIDRLDRGVCKVGRGAEVLAPPNKILRSFSPKANYVFLLKPIPSAQADISEPIVTEKILIDF